MAQRSLGEVVGEGERGIGKNRPDDFPVVEELAGERARLGMFRLGLLLAELPERL
jgi:hypothetical protein